MKTLAKSALNDKASFPYFLLPGRVDQKTNQLIYYIRANQKEADNLRVVEVKAY